LAEAIGIDTSGLRETLKRFEQSVREETDPDLRHERWTDG
jgi:hypothetical protein